MKRGGSYLTIESEMLAILNSRDEFWDQSVLSKDYQDRVFKGAELIAYAGEYWESDEQIITKKYYLYESTLVECKTHGLKQELVSRLDLKWSRVSVRKADMSPYKYYLRISKAEGEVLIFLGSKEELEKWVNALEKCLLVFEMKQCKSRYEIEQEIGHGHSTTIYQAKRFSDQSKVIVKEINFDRASEERKNTNEIKKALRNEIEILHKLNGLSAFPDVYGFYESNEAIRIVMEYAEGQPLTKLHDIFYRSPVFRIELIKEMVYGLRDLKNACIIHRDIKPDNIIVKISEGILSLKIIDFGVSVLLSNELIAQGITKTLGFSGTPGYIAPELFENESQPDFKTDLYSLGVTYYYLVTGMLPFSGESVGEIMKKNRRGSIEFDAPILGGLESQESRLLHELLEKNPNRRPSVEEIMRSVPYFESEDINNEIESLIISSGCKVSAYGGSGTIKNRFHQGQYSIKKLVSQTSIH